MNYSTKNFLREPSLTTDRVWRPVHRCPIICAFLVSCFLLTSMALGSDKQQRPNIVLIMADDMGYSDVGCYGGEIKTPNIDSLAAGGLRFTQFYNTGRCCPTRASLLTGLYPHEAGIGHMVYGDKGPGYHPYLNQQCVTIAEVLRDAGYRTMMTGKWHVGHQKGQWPSDRGFEDFYGIHIHVDSYFKVLPNCPVYHNDKLVIEPTANPENTLHPDQEWYTTDVFTDWSLNFLDEAAKDDRPFFLYTAYNSPHWPLEAPDESIDSYDGKYDGGWDELRSSKLEEMRRLGIVSKETELSPSNCPTWESLSAADQKELAFRREIYAAQVDRMDQNIGRIVAKLRDLGKLENTLILFLSDNGCCAEGGMFGYQWKKNHRDNFAKWRKSSGRSSSTGEAWSNVSNAPFRMHKRWVHEGGIATPLIAHWPKLIRDGGKLSQQVGHVIDVMATCVDVAAAEYPAEHHGEKIKPASGVTLLPALKQTDDRRSRSIYWEHETHAAIRDGDWKLVTLDATKADAWELYDLSQVRTETQDLAEQHPERVDQMKQQWIAWANEANVLPWPKDRNLSKAKAAVSDVGEASKPNVIFFMADDMGMGDTSAYQSFTGSADEVQVHTPSMERLARMGVRFTDAHTPSSRCSPTRYGLLTGRDPWRTRLKHWVLFGAQGDPLIEKDRPTLATLFGSQGYRTGVVGKWHVGLLYRRSDGSISDSLEDADLTQPLADGPVDHGFQFARFNSRSHGSSAPNTKTRKKGGPGFIHDRELVSVKGPNSFFEKGPKAYILSELGGQYSDHAIDFLSSHLKGGTDESKPFFLYYPSNSNHKTHTPDDEIAGVPIKGHSKTKSGQPGTTRMDYVYENDVALGRLITWLEANEDPRRPGHKLVENTIVIFTSDNGAESNKKAFTGPFRSYKASCYEGGHRVPFLVSWKAGGVGDGDSTTAGRDNSTPISLSDMFATFSEVLDVPLPDLAAGEKGAEDSVSALAYWKGDESDRSAVPMFCNDNANGFKQTKQEGGKPTSG
ncbi:MAG: sulfatase-like hydrolase/transferase, partial [Planctomycetota bacterium]